MRTRLFIAAAIAALVAAIFFLLPWLAGDAAPEVPASSSRTMARTPAHPGLDADGALAPMDALARFDKAPPIDLPVADLRGKVLRADRSPAADATVILATRPAGLGTATRAARTVQTDADGSFVFRELMVGGYRLEARHQDEVSPIVAAALTTTSAPITLVLVPGADLEVEILDQMSHEPIGGARVRVGVGDGSFVGIDMYVEGKTDDAGLARFRGLGSVAAHPVYAEAEGYLFNMVNLLPFQNVGRERWRAKVLLRPGVAQLSGRVIDAGGAPVPGAKVGFLDGENEGLPGLFDVMPMPDLVGAVVTDEDGHFTVSTHGGSGCLVADAPRRQLAMSCGFAVVVGQHREGIELVVPDGVRLAGVVRRRGLPAAGATVMLTMKDVLWQPMFSHIYRYQTTADRNGAFAFNNVEPRALLAYAYDDEGVSELLPLDLTRPADRQVALELTGEGRIAGRVAEEDGRPVANAIVEYGFQRDFDKDPIVIDETGTAESPAFYAAARTIGATLTDAGGNFVITGLHEGRYKIAARRPVASSVAPAYGTTFVYGVATGSSVDLTLPVSGGIRGRVLYEDGSPVRSYRVGIVRVSRKYPERVFEPGHEVTAEDGSFAITDIPRGDYALEIWGKELVTLRVAGPVKIDDQVTDLGTVRVGRGQQREGLVLDLQGRPALGAKVTIDTGDPVIGVITQQSGARGEFAVPALRAGAVARVRADRERMSAAWQPIPAQGPVELRLELGGKGIITGVVMDSTPVLGRLVLLTARGEGMPVDDVEVKMATRCDQSGRFLLVDVPADHYALRVQGAVANQFKVLDDVVVEAQKETPVVVVMSEP